MSKQIRDVVIASAVRTPIGSFMGSLSAVPVTKLGSVVIEHSIARAGINKEDVNEVIMGNVLPAGVGQAPARQSCIYAGLPKNVECMTINKVCGSGLKSVMLAAQAIALGDADIIVAGGMESMSNAPYLLFKARTGYRMGNGELIDGMIYDGLWDIYNNIHMGVVGDMCAKKYNISREEQDNYAIESYKRAIKAQDDGTFKEEIIPVEIPQKKGDPIIVSEDEEPKKVIFDKVSKLPPAFGKDGTITAANASKINDGASAVVVMAEETAKKLNVRPLVKIIGQASVAKDPLDFPLAPAEAINKVLKKIELSISDIDLFEVNEAFSAVALYTIKELKLDHSKVNVHGGAVALGHPIGASGARVLTTLIHAMKKYNVKRGLATLCIGGGEASALVVENL